MVCGYHLSAIHCCAASSSRQAHSCQSAAAPGPFTSASTFLLTIRITTSAVQSPTTPPAAMSLIVAQSICNPLPNLHPFPAQLQQTYSLAGALPLSAATSLSVSPGSGTLPLPTFRPSSISLRVLPLTRASESVSPLTQQGVSFTELHTTAPAVCILERHPTTAILPSYRRTRWATAVPRPT